MLFTSCLYSQKEHNLDSRTDYRLMQVKSIVECSLSYHFSLRSLFCLFLSGRFTQVFLYSFSNDIYCGFY